MGNKGAFLRVGLLIVVGVVAILGLILFLSGDRFKRGQTFETYFTESIQGLEVGAPVKYRGVSLGRVTAMGLVSAEYAASQDARRRHDRPRRVVALLRSKTLRGPTSQARGPRRSVVTSEANQRRGGCANRESPGNGLAVSRRRVSLSGTNPSPRSENNATPMTPTLRALPV